MQTGVRISAIGHALLVALAIFGLPWFGPRERPPIRVTDVSFVSEAEFEAAQSAAQGPKQPDAPAKPPVPRPPKQAEAKPPAPEAPAPTETVPEAAPEVAAAAPAPAEDAAEAPDEPAKVTPHIVTLPETAATPPAPRRPARVAPEATPAPPEELKVAEKPQPAPTPEPDAQVAKVEEPPAAQPEAAPESEAAPAPEAPLALETSTPPMKRQLPKPVPEKTAEAAPTPPKPVPAKPASPKPVPAKPAAKDPADTVMAALKREVTKARQRQAAQEAGATPATDPTEPTVTDATETSLPDGPPLTSSEKDGLRLAVQRCWNVPAGLRDANQLKVTLAAELGADGGVINASIRLIDPSPAPDGRFQQAYEAGRRALIRCSPYSDLPRDKYGQWRDIEVVFNPEGMVSW